MHIKKTVFPTVCGQGKGVLACILFLKGCIYQKTLFPTVWIPSHLEVFIILHIYAD